MNLMVFLRLDDQITLDPVSYLPASHAACIGKLVHGKAKSRVRVITVDERTPVDPTYKFLLADRHNAMMQRPSTLPISPVTV